MTPNLEHIFSVFRDDDINDVAAMGGVNLAEESQRILGSTELIGTQIRSCRDEAFLQSIPLQSKIKAIGGYTIRFYSCPPLFMFREL
jgi:transcription initiation factor TFIID subunit 4